MQLSLCWGDFFLVSIAIPKRCWYTERTTEDTNKGIHDAAVGYNEYASTATIQFKTESFSFEFESAFKKNFIIIINMNWIWNHTEK